MNELFITDILYNNILDDYVSLYLSLNKLVEMNEQGEPVVQDTYLDEAKNYAIGAAQRLFQDWEEKLNGEIKIVKNKELEKNEEEE